MSSARRNREQLAPSLFPFLAVLLCTMGALVLLLMLIVSDAQATAQEVAQVAEDRKEELHSLAEAKLRSQQGQLDDQRFELEKKRLMLQHFEEHIEELTQELVEISQAIKLAQDSTNEQRDKEEQLRQLTELEKQLADAQRKLEQQLDEPEGDKPVFAVIPYEGPNGTHRRPIYLECRSDGLVLQPEGVLLTLDNLEPPYGPGNPLDAALRTIRNEYKPKSGAITRTAYPLLLVRPSGVRTYAMARAALSSWDDQFGYELIDEELDLVFPEGVPGLEEKLAKAIEVARQRQSSLVRAMPRQYQPLQGGSGGRGAGPGTPSPLAGGAGTSSFADSPTNRSWKGAAGLPGFGGEGPELASDGGLGSGNSGNVRRSTGSLTEDLLASGQNTPGSSLDSRSLSTPLGDSTGLSGESYFGTGGQRQAGNSEGETGDSSSGGYGGSSSTVTSQDGSKGGATEDSSGTPSLENFLARDSGAQGDSGASGGTGSTGSGNSQPSSSSASMNSGQPGSGSAAAPMMGQSMSGAFPGSSPSSPDQDANAAPQLSLNADFSKSESAEPVAARRGRNWAWRNGPRTQTPVVRNVHLHCFVDSWVLLPENGDVNQSLTIPFKGTPEQRAVFLAKAILDRVDSWGLALAGGYWKPVLVVDVAPQAAWRFDQLKRLMNGSGLEIKLRTRTAQVPGSTNSGSQR